MNGSGRRHGSKWDMKDGMSPENRRDNARSNKTGNSFHEHESRDRLSARRRDDRMNEESMLGGGQFVRRMSQGPDGPMLQSRSRSPRRVRGRSYRSRSKSRSRSRSPAYNHQREPVVHRSSSKPGHSATLCRDFPAGRCVKGDLCRFAHHSSTNHDSMRYFEGKSGDGWDRRRGNDGGLRYHSEPHSGGRSTHICHEYLKGRCTRGASCKNRHHDSDSDEFVDGKTDVSHRDGVNGWRSKSGSSYDRDTRTSSQSLCRYFDAGYCRNGNNCKFYHQRDGQYNSERRSPEGRQPGHMSEGMNRNWNDRNWGGDRNSLRRVPEASEWDMKGSGFRDPPRSNTGEWSKDGLPSHEMGDSTYTGGATSSGNEKLVSIESQSFQWKSNDISVSVTKTIDKGFNDGKILSPKGTYNLQMGHVGQRSDSQSYPQTYLTFGEKVNDRRASAGNDILASVTKTIDKSFSDGKILSPKGTYNLQMGHVGQRSDSQSYPQTYLNFGEQVTDRRATAENDISVSVTKTIDKGFSDGKILSPKGTYNLQMDHAGQRSDSQSYPQTYLSFGEQMTDRRPSAENHYLSGIMQPNISGDYSHPKTSFPVDITPGARNNGNSHVNVNIDIPRGQGACQDGGSVPQPLSIADTVQHIQPICNVQHIPPISTVQHIQPISTMQHIQPISTMQHIQPISNVQHTPPISTVQHIQPISTVDSVRNIQPISTVDIFGQSQATLPLPPAGEHMQISHHQPVLDMNKAMGQSQLMFPSLNQSQGGMQIPSLMPAVDSNPSDEAYVGTTGITQPPTGVDRSQKTILIEQLAQHSQLSASLHQLLLNQKQLPQIYAAGKSQQTSSILLVAAASEPAKQHDSSGSILETKVTECLAEQSSLLGASELPSLNCNLSGGMIATDDKKLGLGVESQPNDHHFNVEGPAVVIKEINGTGKGANETEEALDQGPADDIAIDSGADDGKKSKDAKGVRSFKFALAEYVKELMKPTWKGGQMNKEVYKTIVKKVVDKVTETIQLDHIPRTKEKIDQYLSGSKPKLSKLVQAYLEKHHKAVKT